MATRVLLHLGDLGVATNRCIFSNVQFHRTKFQVQSIQKQNRNFRRIRNSEETIKSPFIGAEISQNGTSNGRKLLKAFLFTTTFSGASFVVATILEYERVRSQTFKGLNRIPFARSFKSSVTGWRQDLRSWWNGLTEGQRMFYYIAYANTIVFIAWRVRQFQPVMMKYFCINPASSAVCLPMLLSMFSHYNLWHLAANMYVLHSFSTAAVSYLGREHFFAVYLSSGLMSGLFSNTYKILLNRPGYSLGASGAIMGILAFICTQFPETKLSIILIPQFTFSAGTAIKSIMGFDTLGCILGWHFLDHAAHLGGALFGIFWQAWGVEHIWRKRAPLLAKWHEFRNPPKSH